MVRAKMRLSEIVTRDWGGTPTRELVFRCEYDPTLPEDQRFQRATPTGEIRMQVDNDAALAQFTPGKAYYVDFTPVE